MGVVAEAAARAGPHRGREKEPGRGPVAGGRWTPAVGLLDDLPEGPESKPPEGREVVQEKGAAAGKVHLAWLPMAGELRGPGAEVGSPEGSAGGGSSCARR
jgi:hypothetical protein